MDEMKFGDRAGELMLIPLLRLVASPRRNVRRKKTSAQYRAGLKASIAAQGVLQNLVVCPALNGKGKETGDFEVVGGEQRRSVLVELAREGVIGREEEILCRLKSTREAAEASLAENVHRAAMHPADEFEAFKRLVDEGRSVEDVALAFEEAGGCVRRDLFADEDAGHIADIELLHRLALGKLEAAAQPVRREGWAWVEARVTVEYHELGAFGRAQKGLREATAEEQAEVDRLMAERAEVDGKLEALYEAEDPDEEAAQALEERLDELGAKVDALHEARECWTDEVRAVAGAIVTIDRSGKLAVHRGLVRPADRKAAAGAGASGREEAAPKPVARPAHSEALVRRLTAHRTVALQRVLADHAQVALAALAHNCVQRLWGETHWPDSALRMRLEDCDSTLLALGEEELEGGAPGRN